MERNEPPRQTRVARSLRNFDGKLDPIDVSACNLLCADDSVRAGLGLYCGEHHLLTARNWVSPLPVHLADQRAAPLVLFALTMVADFHSIDGLTYGEVALTMPMLAALTGITGRETLLRKVRDLARLGYIYHEPPRDRLTPSFIRIFPMNIKTGRPIFQAEASWRPDFVHGVERGAPVSTIRATKSRNFLINPATITPAPAPEIAARVASAPIFIVNPPTIQDAPFVAKDDEFLQALDVPGLHDLVRAHRGQLPPELEGLGEPDQESMRSIFQDDRMIAFKFTPVESAGDQNRPRGLSERGGIRHDNYNDYDSMIVGGASPNSGEAPLACASGAVAAPPPAAPPGASELFVAPLSQRLRHPGRWNAVLAARGPRLTRDERLTLPPSQVACVEAFERFLGIPFCGADLIELKKAMTRRGGRFVKRRIEECARSIFAYDATREGMAFITKAVIAGWDALQDYNKDRFPKMQRAKGKRAQPKPWRQP